jgi:hypothetical protein
MSCTDRKIRSPQGNTAPLPADFPMIDRYNLSDDAIDAIFT